MLHARSLEFEHKGRTYRISDDKLDHVVDCSLDRLSTEQGRLATLGLMYLREVVASKDTPGLMRNWDRSLRVPQKELLDQALESIVQYLDQERK